MSFRQVNKPIVTDAVIHVVGELKENLDIYKNAVLTSKTKVAAKSRCAVVDALRQLSPSYRLPAQFKFSALDQELICQEIETALKLYSEKLMEEAAVTESDLFNWKNESSEQ